MKIVAILGVKDEVELISASIDHLRSIGVDQMIVCDYGSRDGTLAILEALKTGNDIWLVPVEPVDETDWVNTESSAFALARTAQADWVLFLDADEFWIPATGSLRDLCALTDADVLRVDRFNVALTERGPRMPDVLSPAHYEDLLLCVQTIPDFHVSMEQHPEVPFILGAAIQPKVLVRPAVVQKVAVAAHDAEPGGGGSSRRATPADLIIAHLPFTTFERFERKVINIREDMRKYPNFFTGHTAWHWQRWATLSKAGQLREEFERQVLGERQLAELLSADIIQSASVMFEERLRGAKRG